MIRDNKIDEVVTELSDLNLDLTEPIDQQDDDLKHYGYFILAVLRMFGKLSYFESVTFITKLK